jgi:hypothetical protein
MQIRQKVNRVVNSSYFAAMEPSLDQGMFVALRAKDVGDDEEFAKQHFGSGRGARDQLAWGTVHCVSWAEKLVICVLRNL